MVDSRSRACLGTMSHFHRTRALVAYSLVLLLFNAFLAVASQASDSGKPVIVALGDSLVAGYGLAPQDSFTTQLDQALQQAGISAQIVNAGVSGDTSAGGLARLDWVLQGKIDLVIVELGANDGLRGLAPAATRDNLDQLLAAIQKRHIRILLTGMKAPPNLGTDYGQAFNQIYPDLAEKYDLPLYPFFLDGVAAQPALNQADGIHPNADGVAEIVRRLTPVLVELLDEIGS